MRIKAACQPQASAISGTVIGAKIAPMFAPELKIPVANERSFLGKYSAVALIAAGELSGLLETAHLLRSPKNAERLLTALAHAQTRTLSPQSIAELRGEVDLGEPA